MLTLRLSGMMEGQESIAIWLTRERKPSIKQSERCLLISLLKRLSPVLSQHQRYNRNTRYTNQQAHRFRKAHEHAAIPQLLHH
jgi:hypothetical protein